MGIAWKWYCLYEQLGGNPHQPSYEPLGRFLRKLLIWMPLRWLFTPIMFLPPMSMLLIAISGSIPYSAKWFWLGVLVATNQYAWMAFAVLSGEYSRRKEIIPLMNDTVKVR